MIPLLIRDGRNALGGGTRTFIFGKGVWIDTTGDESANAVSVALVAPGVATPNLTYAELHKYAVASGAATAEQLAAYKKAAEAA